MASSTSSALGGEVVNLSDIIDDMEEELEAHDRPLLDAVRVGDIQAVQEAIASLHSDFPMQAKILAVEKRDPDLLRVLLEADDKIEESLVEAACISKDQACIVALLDFGLSINRPLNPDQYVLWAAVDDITFARFLVHIGADVNCRSRYNVSALSVAIAIGSIDVVHFLISQETDIAHGDLLHCAAMRENQTEGAELVEELAQKGVDVNTHSFNNLIDAPFQKRRTPLHIAVQRDNTAVARALIKNGADPSRMCIEVCEPVGPTALEEAMAKKNKAMIQLLTVDS